MNMIGATEKIQPDVKKVLDNLDWVGMFSEKIWNEYNFLVFGTREGEGMDAFGVIKQVDSQLLQHLTIQSPEALLKKCDRVLFISHTPHLGDKEKRVYSFSDMVNDETSSRVGSVADTALIIATILEFLDKGIVPQAVS